jgi:hypothetical protein
MTAREHAEELRRQAIKELLAEKNAIDDQLALLGHGKETAAPPKKRGRPRKEATPPMMQIELPPAHS